MRLRERPAASIALPVPAPLPSLQAAFSRRAAIFGPCDADEPPAASRSTLMRCAAVLRGRADVLTPAPGMT